MRIQSINSLINTSKSAIKNNYFSNPMLKTSKIDSFEKQNQVSFKSRKETDNNLVDAMSQIGMAGGATLLSVVAGVAMVKAFGVEDLFLDEDGYEIDFDNLSIDSNNVQADADDGIFKVKNLGIDIDPSRFSRAGDTFDPANGVYKTADGSIDIDLQNNKYIDEKNGIYVDPEEKISALVDENGEVKHFALPTFGSGHALFPYNDPTDYDSSDERYIKSLELSQEIFELAKKEKAWDKVISDLFGRQTITATDENGNQYLSTLSEKLPKGLSKFGTDSQVVRDHAKSVNDAKFNIYRNLKHSSFEEFEKTVKEKNNSKQIEHQGFENMSIVDLVQNDVHRIALNQYMEEGHTMQEALADDDGNGIPNFMEEHAFYKGVLQDFIEDGHTLLEALADDDGNGIPNFMEDSPFYKSTITAYLDRGYSIQDAFGDINVNGIPDFIEDNVHYRDAFDNYLLQGHTVQEAFNDEDENGIPDFLQSDPTHMNAINDYLQRGYSIESAFADDDGDGIPNYLDDDMNGNGIPDYLEGI